MEAPQSGAQAGQPGDTESPGGHHRTGPSLSRFLTWSQGLGGGPPLGPQSPLLDSAGATPGLPPGGAQEPPPKRHQSGGAAGLRAKIVSWKTLSGGLAVLVLLFFGLWLAHHLGDQSGNAAPLEPCPDVWMYYAKHCYYYSDIETDWTSAQESCEANKASLVTFKHLEEMDYILKRAGKKSYWTGLRRREGGLEWVSGDLLDHSLFQVHGQEECGFIWSKNGLVISLSTCSLPRGSICKMEPYS